MYRITIEKLNVTSWTDKERVLVEERPYTEEEMSNTNRYFQTAQEQGVELKKIYELVPVEKEKKTWEEIYVQTVDELDIPKIVMDVVDFKREVQEELSEEAKQLKKELSRC